MVASFSGKAHRRHYPAGRLKPQECLQGPGAGKGRGLSRRLRPGGRRVQRRSCSKMKNPELQVKKADRNGGQAGVVATPACVLDWDSGERKNRRRAVAEVADPTPTEARSSVQGTIATLGRVHSACVPAGSIFSDRCNSPFQPLGRHL